MPDDDAPVLSRFFQALKDTLEEAGDDAAIVTIIMPDGQLCDFAVSYMGEHESDGESGDGSGGIWTDDTQGI